MRMIYVVNLLWNKYISSSSIASKYMGGPKKTKKDGRFTFGIVYGLAFGAFETGYVWR
jgi:hypothetical protein